MQTGNEVYQAKLAKRAMAIIAAKLRPIERASLKLASLILTVAPQFCPGQTMITPMELFAATLIEFCQQLKFTEFDVLRKPKISQASKKQVQLQSAVAEQAISTEIGLKSLFTTKKFTSLKLGQWYADYEKFSSAAYKVVALKEISPYWKQPFAVEMADPE